MTKIKPNTIVASDEALLVTQAGSLSASAASPYAIFSSVEGLEFATKHLHDADEKLRPLITKHGPPHRLLAKEESVFKRISQSIVFQQLATQAAVAIYARVLATCGCSESLTPGALLGADPQALRAAGLSQRKVEYLLDLAAHFTDGRLTDEGVRGMDLETLQRELVQVRGLGTWSVHMFALFHRGCADVLPVGDLGVRKGMQMLYGLRELPDVKAMERVAEGWKPYRSAGAWYMWKVVEDEQEARVAARAAKAALAAEAKLARLEARAVAKALKEASPPKRRKKAGEEE